MSDWSSDVCSSDLSALYEVVVASPAGKRCLRKLMLRTALVDHGEIETLLENYERIATQSGFREGWVRGCNQALALELPQRVRLRSEEHTSELQSLMRISYDVFCLKKKKKQQNKTEIQHENTYTKKKTEV